MNTIVKPIPNSAFRDSARTVLPIELSGRVFHMDFRAYEDAANAHQGAALIHRKDDAPLEEIPIVRVHSGCMTGDIFHSLRCDCYQQLSKALGAITSSAYGVIVYLPHQEGRGIGLVNKIKAYAAQDRGLDTVDANISIGEPVDARDYGFAANILQDIGARKIRLLTNNPAKVTALRALGIEVIEQVPVITTPSDYNARYLQTKKDRMSHKL